MRKTCEFYPLLEVNDGQTELTTGLTVSANLLQMQRRSQNIDRVEL